MLRYKMLSWKKQLYKKKNTMEIWGVKFTITLKTKTHNFNNMLDTAEELTGKWKNRRITKKKKK